MYSPHRFASRHKAVADLIAQGYDPPLAYKTVFDFYPRGRDTWRWLAALTTEVIERDEDTRGQS